MRKERQNESPPKSSSPAIAPTGASPTGHPSIDPAPSAPPPALAAGPLRQDLAQAGVAAVDAGVVDAHVALQVVGARVLVLAVAGAEGAHVARRVVHQPVPDHLVLALEAAPAHAPRAVRHRAVVRPRLRVHVRVRAVQR